jgi:hypothetical protein
MMMTQELIANMLGVRREGVSVAAFRLQRDGLIRYSRGCIEVLDRAGLERRACKCYGVVKRECNRLLPAMNQDATAEAITASVRLPDDSVEAVLASRARAAQRVRPEARKAQGLARTRLGPAKGVEEVGQRKRAVDASPRSPVAGVEAFLAMSTIMSGRRIYSLPTAV